MGNDATLVAVGKPKVGGAIYRAPYGTVLPTDATTALDAAFKCLGYASDDGLKNENKPSTETLKAWGGDTVGAPLKEKTDNFTFTLIESLNVEVLKAIFGDSNVTGTLATGITVSAVSEDSDASAWVFDIKMGKNAKRVVLPNAKISEVAEITYKDDEAVGYETTLTAMQGDSTFNYATHKEYIVAPSTGA